MNTAKFIRATRKSMHLTQEQLATLVGKRRLNITCYETDRSTPPGDVVLKIISLRFPKLLCSLEKQFDDTSQLLKNQEVAS